jgi:hypothetical protein
MEEIGCTQYASMNRPSREKFNAVIVGDLWFHYQRRAWMQAANRFGVKTFGYLLTDPGAPPISPPTVGPTAHDALGGEKTSFYSAG